MPLNETRLNHFLALPFIEQGPIFYPPQSWANSLTLDDRHQFDLPNIRLDRIEVRSICRDHKCDPLFGYLCAMAWGGQGVGRTRRNAISAWRYRQVIKDKLLTLRNNSAISRSEANDLFYSEKSITGLGPSYWTKLIFFFSEKKDRYILDQWTAKSINFLYDATLIPMNGDMPDRAKCTGTLYEIFCTCIDEITAVANQRKSENRIWTGEMVEQQLFSSGGSNPGQFRRTIRQWWNTKDIVHGENTEITGSKQAYIDENLWVTGYTLARTKPFRWVIDETSSLITIIREFDNSRLDDSRQRLDTFSISELVGIVNNLRKKFGETGIPLANSVASMSRMPADAGLGAAMLRNDPQPDPTRAQAASQIAAVLVTSGFAYPITKAGTRIVVPREVKVEDLRSALQKIQNHQFL